MWIVLGDDEAGRVSATLGDDYLGLRAVIFHELEIHHHAIRNFILRRLAPESHHREQLWYLMLVPVEGIQQNA